MPEVYNWQLGRKMLYPYEERHPKWQFAFVFNINRCLACQTCSMADKSTWLFSKGQEYMWWNNVETKPYGGYPQFYDVKITQLIEQVNPGGQVWNVRVGRKHHAPYGVFEGMTIFDAGAKVGQAAIGYIPTDQEWRFVNIYEDTATSMRALVENIDKSGFTRDEPWRLSGSSLPEHETYFFYLQRICNHCTYPGCLAACPRKAIYKREEDGIVLIDQDKCRGWRMCVSACPYKKIYFNWSSGKSEKCIFCYPRIESGQPTVCSETCVGRLRYLGLVLYDADRVKAAASVPNEKDLLAAQLDLFLDPNDPAVIAQARADGIAAGHHHSAGSARRLRLGVGGVGHGADRRRVDVGYSDRRLVSGGRSHSQRGSAVARQDATGRDVDGLERRGVIAKSVPRRRRTGPIQKRLQIPDIAPSPVPGRCCGCRPNTAGIG